MFNIRRKSKILFSDNLQLLLLPPDDGLGRHVLDESADEVVPAEGLQEPGSRQKLVKLRYRISSHF